MSRQASRHMQAALKAGAGEVARGLSTGVIVWAGSGQCPACAPVLHCGEVPRCPDCVCGHSGRIYADPLVVWTTAWLLFLCGCSLLAGVVLAAAAVSVPFGKKEVSKKNVVKAPVVVHSSSDDGGRGAGLSAARSRARAIRG